MNKETERRHAEDRAWLESTFYVAESGSVSKAAVYEAYARYCLDEEGKGRATASVFGRMIVSKAFPDVATRRQGKRGQVQYHYDRLQFIRLQDRPTGPYITQTSPSSAILGDNRYDDNTLTNGTKETTSPGQKKTIERTRKRRRDSTTDELQTREAHPAGRIARPRGEFGALMAKGDERSSWESLATAQTDTTGVAAHNNQHNNVEEVEEEEEFKVTVTEVPTEEGDPLQSSWNDPCASFSSLSSLLACYQGHTSGTTPEGEALFKPEKAERRRNEDAGGTALCSTATGPFFFQSLYSVPDAPGGGKTENSQFESFDRSRNEQLLWWSLEPYACSSSATTTTTTFSQRVSDPTVVNHHARDKAVVGLEESLVRLRDARKQQQQQRKQRERPAIASSRWKDNNNIWKSFDFNAVMDMLDTHASLSESSAPCMWGVVDC